MNHVHWDKEKAIGEIQSGSVFDNNFSGNAIRSTSREFEIQYGITCNDGNNLFRYVKQGSITKTCKVESRISFADILDNGIFLIGLCNQNHKEGYDVFLFDANCIQITSIYIPSYPSFVRLQPPRHLLLSYDSKVMFLQIEPTWTIFSFKLPTYFYPRDGWIIKDDSLNIITNTEKLYTFKADGTFCDYTSWRNDFLHEANAPSIFNIIKEETEEIIKQNRFSEQVAISAIDWLDYALLKNEEDSFSYKKEKVYRLKAVLLNLIGDTLGAIDANEKANNNADGFSVVDSIGNELKNDKIGTEDLTTAIFRLDKAAHYPRLKEYPNYFGRLLRYKGEIFMRLNDPASAIIAFEEALIVNPDVGCKKMLVKAKHLTDPLR